jgi:DNA invertase Pin-like site-specific DNA recombinase
VLKKQKAVVYTRVSSAEQVENHSLATQKRACEEFCERGGIEVETSLQR